MAVHSQLISCSASEIHAMVEGAMRHGTSMEIEQNFVDSHGASFVGFGITRLLDFDLIARFKQINTMKLYVPGPAGQYSYPMLAPALTRPVRWKVIENNCDLMTKYATAIRLRTASTEALPRRFTSETTHPAYAAMLETGRAQRSIFLARWLRDRDLQRETESGLNVVENYNGVNDYIRFGKRGELASNRREEQELGMLCLHILQSSLGLVFSELIFVMICSIWNWPGRTIAHWCVAVSSCSAGRSLTPDAWGRCYTVGLSAPSTRVAQLEVVDHFGRCSSRLVRRAGADFDLE